MPVSGSGGGGGSVSAASIRAGKAHVELSAKDKGVGPALEKMRKRVLAFGKLVGKIGVTMSAAALPILGVMGKAVSSFVDRGSEIKKIADRTGASTEAVSELAYTFEQVGLNVDNVADAVKDLQDKLSKAEGGDGFSTALAEIGLNAQQLKGMRLEDQFDAIADGIALVQNPADRTRLMLEILGGQGDKLAGIFSEGSAGLRRYREEAKLVGASMPREEAERAAAASKSFHAIISALTYAFHQIALAILPSNETIKEFTQDVLNTIKGIREWIQENQSFVRLVGIVSLSVLGAGAALVAFGLIVSGLATAVGGLVIAIKAVIAVVGAIVSPIGLAVVLVAALAGGIGYLVYQSEAGRAAFGRFMAFLSSLKDVAVQTFRGIGDALAAGDIRLALDIALKGALVVWRLFLVELQKGWNWFKGWFVEAWHKVGETIGNVFVGIMEWVFKTFGDVIGWVTEKLAKLARKVGLDETAKSLDVFTELANDPQMWGAIRDQIEKDRKAARAEREAAREEGLRVAKDELAQAQEALDEATRRAALLRAAKKVNLEQTSSYQGGMPESERIADRAKGVFSAPNYKQVFNVSDTIAKRQLSVQEQIRDAVGKVSDGIEQLKAQWKFA